jgi:predicted translin family RNA/ssDNA-binding protein
MIKQNFIAKIKKEYQNKEKERVKIIVFSNHILHQSKRIIFSLQRGDLTSAQEDLKLVVNLIITKQKEIKIKRLEEEGSYKAALEEFAEAYLFQRWLNKKEISEIKEVKIRYDCYIGALSDLCGEMARFSVNQAAKKNVKVVEKVYNDALEIISQLNKFNLTGPLRNKYDQACNHLRKIEQVNYDVKIRSL